MTFMSRRAQRNGAGLASVFALLAFWLLIWPATTGATESKVDNARAPLPSDEGVLSGRVSWVTDGDSLRVFIKGRNMEVRLSDIDAPEREQPFGWQAKLRLMELVGDRHVVLQPRDVDRYGRVVARLWVGDADVNLELVRAGLAWFYPQYARDERLYYAEQAARDAKRGLWALPREERVEPWHWRKQTKPPASSRVE